MKQRALNLILDGIYFSNKIRFQGLQAPTTAGAAPPASADIHFALRISKQTGNITEVSPVLTEFTLRGIYNPSQNGIDKQKRLTFILK